MGRIRIRKHGLCSACMELRDLQGHHVLPKRQFTDTPNSPFCFLCQSCHSELHKDFIDPLGYPPREVFISATRDFLMEKRKQVALKFGYRHL